MHIAGRNGAGSGPRASIIEGGPTIFGHFWQRPWAISRERGQLGSREIRGTTRNNEGYAVLARANFGYKTRGFEFWVTPSFGRI